MPSDAATVLLDIEHHIKLAEQFVTDLDFPEFQDDLRSLYAVIRYLEIISEASRRLPDELKARHPLIPWREIACAGNIYRHDYEDVAARLVWDTVKLALPSLNTAIASEIERASR